MGNCLAKQKKYQDIRKGESLADQFEIQQPNHIQLSQTFIQTVPNPSIQPEVIERKPATSTKLQNSEQIISNKPIIRVFMKYDQEKPAVPKKGIRVYHTCSVSHICSSLELVEDLWFSHNQIGFSSGPVSEEESFQTLKKIKKATKIHNWRSIKSINFSTFKFGHETSGKDLRTFILDMGQQFDLKQAKFNLPSCDGVDGRAVKTLGSNISRHLVELKQLQLQFPYCHRLSEVGLDLLGSEISRDRLNLELLTLNFSGCQQKRDKTLEAFQHNVHRNLFTLKQFTLILETSAITDKGLRALAIAISKHLKNLKRFSLNLSGSIELTDQGLEYLVSTISTNLSNLNYLALNFSSCRKISDNGLEACATHFSNCSTNLESLKLEFQWCNLSNSGIENFCFQVSQRLPNLKQIHLNLKYCQSITRDCLEKLNEIFVYIQNKNRIINLYELK